MRFLAFAISLLTMASLSASAATMTFEGFASPGTWSDATSGYLEAGFKVAGSSLTIVDSGGAPDMVGNDSDYAMFDPHAKGITLTAVSGASFQLSDLMIGPSTHPLPVFPVTFTLQGTQVGGGMLSASFSGLTTSTLATLNWQNLSSVKILASSNSIMVGMDNINATIVPEPAGAVLALSMVFAAIRHRRRLV